MLGSNPAAADSESWQHHARYVVPRVPRPAAARARCDALCIHVAKSSRIDGTLPARAAKAAAKMADALTAFGLPPPVADGGLGGSFALDIYLDAHARGGAAYADPRATLHFDRASAYGVVGTAHPHACGFESAVARAVAQATLLGLDAAQHDSTLALQASYLASLVSPCVPAELEAIDAAQRTPELSMSRAPRHAISGAFLFSSYLDAVWSAGIGTMMHGLIATSAQHGDPGAARFTNEPDIYDAFRNVMIDNGKRFGDLLIDYAVARAFMGDRSDGAHLPRMTHLGAMGRVRFEWVLDYASLPRRVAPLHDVEPTGASYLWLDLKSADPHAALIFIADWESTHAMQWALVRVDDRGQALGRHIVGGVFGHDRAEHTVDDIDGAAALLIVGIHLGHDDRARQFDPDVGGPRPTSYTVTLHPK